MLAFVQAISTSAPCFNLAFLTLKALFAFIFTQSTFPAEHYWVITPNRVDRQTRRITCSRNHYVSDISITI
jgi:hypothetical protein